ncbi:MAG: BMP family ABC transporter substrate-binding protein, partial [Oscillospiraceae bacterium]
AINAGADVIHAVAGSAGNGALEAAQSKKLLGIGVDSDQYELFKTDKPELAASIVTSSLKNVGQSLYMTIDAIQKGTFVGGSRTWFGMPEGCAGIAENENYKKLVDADTQAYIEDVKAKMAAGEIKVDSFFDMKDEDYKALKASVEKK